MHDHRRSLNPDPEGGSSKLLKNVSHYVPIEKASYPRRHESLKSQVTCVQAETHWTIGTINIVMNWEKIHI